MPQINDKKDQYLALFDPFLKQQSDDEPLWLIHLRKEAIARFEELGFPTTRDEEWRHTNLSALLDQDFQPIKEDPQTQQDYVQNYFVDNLDAYRLVFINGKFQRDLSVLDKLPAGVRIENIASILQNEPDRLEPYLARKGSFESNPFAALNTAFMQDGVYIHIPQGTIVEKPIHFLYYTTAGSHARVSFPRNVIVAGANTESVLVESYAGPSGEQYFTSAMTEISLGANATMEHCKLQREGDQAFHVSFFYVHLDKDSRFKNHSLVFGGGLVRNDIKSVLDDEGIECILNGLYMVDQNRHVDNHTWIDHLKPHCESHELYKGILDDHASGVFKGQIYVAKDAQKTDAKQTNQALLLSDDAEINTMPQLEIYADDVKCTHGSTTGQLDESAMFYLRARGISRQSARFLLTYAFASEVINQIGNDAIRSLLDRLLHERLPMG